MSATKAIFTASRPTCHSLKSYPFVASSAQQEGGGGYPRPPRVEVITYILDKAACLMYLVSFCLPCYRPTSQIRYHQELNSVGFTCPYFL